jgi:tRNA pseudouridine38-40 synthase
LARYKAILAYDGTEFAGFQRQNGPPTVQGAVEGALASLGWIGGSILAAGRTDAGVHATGQVIAFDVDWGHSDLDLLQALNAKLPASISARSLEKTQDSFHPRYDATARRYRYSFVQDPVRDPIKERYAWGVWPELDLSLVVDAGNHLVGKHDFRAFGSPHQDDRSTVREIRSVAWTQSDGFLNFEVLGNAFLYHMVRRMANAVVRVGQGLHPPSEIRSMLEGGDANRIPGLAPASGLCLVDVFYETELRMKGQ